MQCEVRRKIIENILNNKDRKLDKNYLEYLLLNAKSEKEKQCIKKMWRKIEIDMSLIED